MHLASSQGQSTTIFKNGKVEDLGNYRLVSLASVLRKIMEQVLLEFLSKHTKDKRVTSNR